METMTRTEYTAKYGTRQPNLAYRVHGDSAGGTHVDCEIQACKTEAAAIKAASRFAGKRWGFRNVRIIKIEG